MFVQCANDVPLLIRQAMGGNERPESLHHFFARAEAASGGFDALLFLQCVRSYLVPQPQSLGSCWGKPSVCRIPLTGDLFSTNNTNI